MAGMILRSDQALRVIELKVSKGGLRYLKVA